MNGYKVCRIFDDRFYSAFAHGGEYYAREVKSLLKSGTIVEYKIGEPTTANSLAVYTSLGEVLADFGEDYNLGTDFKVFECYYDQKDKSDIADWKIKWCYMLVDYNNDVYDIATSVTLLREIDCNES